MWIHFQAQEITGYFWSKETCTNKRIILCVLCLYCYFPKRFPLLTAVGDTEVGWMWLCLAYCWVPQSIQSCSLLNTLLTACHLSVNDNLPLSSKRVKNPNSQKIFNELTVVNKFCTLYNIPDTLFFPREKYRISLGKDSIN